MSTFYAYLICNNFVQKSGLGKIKISSQPKQLSQLCKVLWNPHKISINLVYGRSQYAPYWQKISHSNEAVHFYFSRPLFYSSGKYLLALASKGAALYARVRHENWRLHVIFNVLQKPIGRYLSDRNSVDTFKFKRLHKMSNDESVQIL